MARREQERQEEQARQRQQQQEQDEQQKQTEREQEEKKQKDQEEQERQEKEQREKEKQEQQNKKSEGPEENDDKSKEPDEEKSPQPNPNQPPFPSVTLPTHLEKNFQNDPLQIIINTNFTIPTKKQQAITSLKILVLAEELIKNNQFNQEYFTELTNLQKSNNSVYQLLN